MKHRFCALLLLVVLVLTMTACGAKTVASGECGEHLTWTYDESGKKLYAEVMKYAQSGK